MSQYLRLWNLRDKFRAVFYYLLVKHFGKEKVYA